MVLSRVLFLNSPFALLQNGASIDRSTDLLKPSNGDALSMFLNMSLIAVKDLPKYSPVPGLEALTFIVWEVDPRPIIMLENSHLKWYESKSERKIVVLLRHMLTKKYSIEDGIVLDMGINDGYVAALAASYGYKVVGADGQPECIRRFHLAIAVNRWENVYIYKNIISNRSLSIEIPNGVCGGGTRYLNDTAPTIKTEMGISVKMPGKTVVKSETVDNLIQSERVIFFHLDVEGAEVSALQSAANALRERRIENLVWEFAPHRWRDERNQTLHAINKLMENFACLQITDLDMDDPWKNEGVRILDWGLKYAEIEIRRGIVDIWCTLATAS